MGNECLPNIDATFIKALKLRQGPINNCLSGNNGVIVEAHLELLDTRSYHTTCMAVLG